jgi:hypothetical protein
MEEVHRLEAAAEEEKALVNPVVPLPSEEPPLARSSRLVSSARGVLDGALSKLHTA